MMSTNVLIRR